MVSALFIGCSVCEDCVYNTIDHDGTNFHAIKTDNALWTWKDGDEKSEPIKSLDDVTSINNGYANQNNGDLWECRENPIKIAEDVKYVSAVDDSVCFIGLKFADKSSEYGYAYKEYWIYPYDFGTKACIANDHMYIPMQSVLENFYQYYY